MACMDAVAVAMLSDIQGSVCSYVLSDEISVLLTDFKYPETEAWFGGNLQKMASVSASIATGVFNKSFQMKFPDKPVAFFDSRVFTIPDPVEVENYFIWRQKDAIRNSIQNMGLSCFSSKELNKKSCSDIKEMLKEIGEDWETLPAYYQRGTFFRRSTEGLITEYMDFIEEREKFRSIIPQYPIFDDLLKAGIERYEEGRNTYYDDY